MSLLDMECKALYTDEVLPDVSYIFAKNIGFASIGPLAFTTLHRHKPAIITIYHEDDNKYAYAVLCPYYDNATMILEDVNDYQAALSRVMTLINMIPDRETHSSTCIIL